MTCSFVAKISQNTLISDDADKIQSYIAHRGANHSDVVALKLADDQQKDIEKNVNAMCQAFDRKYREVTPKGSIKPPKYSINHLLQGQG